MRRAIGLAAVMLFVGATTAMAQTTNIGGSAHDFSLESWNTSGQICIVCHAPHNTSASTNGPLWNHDSSVATYTLYSSSTMDATVGQPGPESKACLSCHDGTVALDSYGGATGTTFITGAALVGTDLSNDHPVGFTYDNTIPGVADPATISSGLGSTIDADLLFTGKLECASCHGVHNEYGVAKLLVKANTASALCQTCHSTTGS